MTGDTHSRADLALEAARMIQHPEFGLEFPPHVRTSLRVLGEEYEKIASAEDSTCDG